MKRLEVLLLPLDGMLVYRMVTPSIFVVASFPKFRWYIYTPRRREALLIFALPLKKTFIMHPESESSSPHTQILHQTKVVHLESENRFVRVVF